MFVRRENMCVLTICEERGNVHINILWGERMYVLTVCEGRERENMCDRKILVNMMMLCRFIWMRQS